MRVIPLGTSSGKPTVQRNVSATVAARESEWLLFDCGEGTQRQIMRAGLSPGRLVSVFITHLHGDHLNGLGGLLSTLSLDRRERQLDLVSPPGVSEYLSVLSRLKALHIGFPLNLSETGAGRFCTWEAPAPHIVFESDDYFVSALPLDHRIFALGYRIQERDRPGRFNVERARLLGVPEGPLFGKLQAGVAVDLPGGGRVHPSEVLGPPRPGRAIAYCTDTRPCAASVELARDVDLLVHEATFADDLSAEAAAYGHSTAAQAARIALEANAGALLLTHFSPRYGDLTVLLNEARAVFPETFLAEELTPVELPPSSIE